MSHKGVLGIARSKNGVPVRLTYERWGHIIESHDYMAGLNELVLETVSDPDAIAEGWGGSLIAIRHYAKTPISEKDAVVVYRETSPQDGFVITAFMTSKVEKLLEGRIVLWQR